MQNKGDNLNLLLKRNYDAERGYEEAEKETSIKSLKDFFHEKHKERYDFGHELKEILSDLGVKPNKGTTLEADVHRGFMKLKELVSTKDEKAIVEECLRGESYIKEAYQEVIDKADLKQQHINTLKEHLHRINNSIDTLNALDKTLA